MRQHLERLHKEAPQLVTAMSYEDAIKRAYQAMNFVNEPYWDVMSGMLSGTIKNETEELLAKDEHMAVNRASVAICRKVLQMPFFDIEQGRMAEELFKKSLAARRRTNQSGLDAPGGVIQ